MMRTREERVKFLCEMIEKKKPRVIAIDGPCASGKTTLAMDLKKRTDFSLICMDDFFLPLEMRTPLRFKEKGGNIHYERFIEEVIKPLSKKEEFIYRRYSCASFSYSGSVYIPSDGLIVVEGSYALHPSFSKYWDMSVFLTVDSPEQIRRLEIRSPDKLDMFISRWIPLENEYFSAYAVSERATYIL